MEYNHRIIAIYPSMDERRLLWYQICTNNENNWSHYMSLFFDM